MFERLVDAVADYAIFVIDPEGRIASWNQGAKRIKGYASRDVLGKSFRMFYSPEDASAGRPEKLLGIAAREGHVEDEGFRVRADGSRFWARVVLTRIDDGDGHLLGFAKVTQDLSERRKLEQTQESARLKDEFLATVSHELRTPIHSVLGWLEILRKPGLEQAARERALQAVERNARAEARIIEDLLDVSRITTGKMRVELAPVDVRSIVDAAIDVVGPGAHAKGVALGVSQGADLPAVAGDRGRLVQVVWNLLANAVKFTPQGGSIQATTRTRDGHVEIEVTDTGLGIAPEFLPLVFDRFRQADSSTTRAVAGLGVGLTIARHLVELHGGTIAAESDGLGKGATFLVRLPAWRGNAPAKKKARKTGR